MALDPEFASSPDQIEAASKRAQMDLVDLQIQLLQDSLLRIDRMIDKCRELRTAIEQSQASA